ncbi:MAG: hypothetical protein JO261_08085 [Alphaproteobacteria bacterium]|nr:hypothetical protein [Alphaproteobacteria bacterium]MBV9693644.1 hypothetical protein [Alphaproteobacteria bacterium]
MKTALLAAAAAAAFFVSPARAESVATRCGWDGCSHIVCNYSGDRCHRYYGDYYHPYYGRRYGYDGYRYGDYDDGYRRESYGRYDWDDYRSRYYGGYGRGGWHYDCDRDGDDCTVRRGGWYGGYGGW